MWIHRLMAYLQRFYQLKIKIKLNIILNLIKLLVFILYKTKQPIDNKYKINFYYYTTKKVENQGILSFSIVYTKVNTNKPLYLCKGAINAVCIKMYS